MMRRLLSILFLLLPFCMLAQELPSDNLMFNCFKNTATGKEEGNCVAVAFIKASIGTFGVNNVFRSVNKEEAARRYNIMLRNGDIVLLGFEELEAAAAQSGFKRNHTDLLSEDICKYACMCYAVMAKKLQLSATNYTYATALTDLSDGYPVDEIAPLLGLTLKPIKPFTTQELEHYNHIIIKNYYYTAYAYLGYYDEVGNTEGYAPFSDIRKNHYGLPCALKRCNISAAYRVDEL